MSDFKIVKLLDPIQLTTVTGGLVPRGAYDAGTNYAVGDSVDYNGSSYVMFNDAGAGTLPTNTTYWQVLAHKGDTGATGGGGGGGGSDTWGAITGTLSDQTDLQTALDAKEDAADMATDVPANEADPVFLASEAANITSTDITHLSNLSGTNTGDQDLSGLVPITRTVNGHALSADVTVSKSDVSLGSVTNDAQLKIASNLSDLASASTARTNLGVAIGTDVLAPTGSAASLTSFPTLNQNTTGSAATLTTPRAIYGNNFNGSAALAQIIASTYGGTGNGFTKFSGPTTPEKTFTLPDASSTIVVQGGALGTPSSATLTNATGLPIAGLTASTSTAVGVGSVELGHASDTTITRTGAGAIAVEGTAVLLSGGALGTPSSGTLTNATGLPVSGITSSTSTALGVGSIELGHASDTTLSRSASGVLAVEGVVLPSISSVNTLTNKRVQPRVFVTTSTATLTPEKDTYDIFAITAQAAALNIANHSTTTYADGEKVEIRILDNGTARAITYGTDYVAKGGIPLPSTTVLSKNMTLGFEYDANLAKLNLVALTQET